MKKLTAKQLREMWIKFYKEKGHAFIPSASLVPENDPSVLFTTAGMHPLVPYLLGEKHPCGKRLVDVQKCVRTGDIDEVGDNYHCTFFEMLGNWSLGDYFKKEKIAWSFEFLTSPKYLDIPKEDLAVTVFAGDETAPRDMESYENWKKCGIPDERIFFLPKEHNWWILASGVGPCGPDSEMFIDTGKPKCCEDCSPACSCGKYVEVGNDVYMEYVKTTKDGEIKQNPQKNVDTGFGLDRLLYISNGLESVYDTELFVPIIKKVEELSGKQYNQDEQTKRNMRIIADHIRASVFIISDGVTPLNVGQGYVLRRLLRRAINCASRLGFEGNKLSELVSCVVDTYKEFYTELPEKKIFVEQTIIAECEKFSKTLETGIKEFEKVASFCRDGKLSGKTAFRLYDTFGFPFELTKELALEKNLTVNEEEYQEAFKKHQEKSKANNDKVFKGGLADTGEQTTKLHTAVHILQAGLRKLISSDIYQKGSNITSERLRFDFNCDHKLTEEEKQKLEDFVNDVIKKDIPVVCEEMTLDQAKEKGALGVFEHKYGDVVKVYTIDGVSCEICGGPHASRTGELKKFKIIKEESSSAGVRRIKATIEA
ncbi:MAG: alanine--tRNA ligase [Clostridia bacterium]|nr:alanine--tRNA ligase [Clostridia bacterium]